MAKTNAQRQHEYRARRALANRFGDSRLNLWVDGQAAKALKRLAVHHGLTQRAMIERLLLAADTEAQAAILPGSPEWQAYFQAGYGTAGDRRRATAETVHAERPDSAVSGRADDPE